MPTPQELLRAGQPVEALAALQQQVRREPGVARHRVFLFQLLAVLGDLPRAAAQLEVAGQLDAQTLLMVQMYRAALECELVRREVVAGRKTPLIFGEPAEWLALLVQSFQQGAQGAWTAALELRERAFAAAPATPGQVTLEDGSTHPFEWLADADPRFGPVLEVILQGKYYWIPLERIARLEIEPPTDLRDSVWAVAHFGWTTGAEAFGLIPARYPGTDTCGQPGLQLARQTDWAEPDPGFVTGLGQRMLASESAEFPLLEIRSIEWHSSSTPQPDSGTGVVLESPSDTLGGSHG
jgi:type VI secretion system protein ImpE